MYENNRNLPGGGKPTAERQREYASGRAVGQTEKAMDEVQQAIKEKKTAELQQGLPKREAEEWNFPLRRDGSRREGVRNINVCRNNRGQFANLSQERAKYLGVMTGRNVPPPKRK